MGSLLKSVDALCARLNAGLAAVAIVLSIIVAAQLTVRMPDLFQQAAAVIPDTTAVVGTGSF